MGRKFTRALQIRVRLGSDVGSKSGALVRVHLINVIEPNKFQNTVISQKKLQNVPVF